MDKEEFVKKILEYKDTVFRVAYSYTKNKSDAEDISQEVFLKFYTSMAKFEDSEQLKAWLIRITINKSKDLLKSSWFSKRSDETDLQQSFTMNQSQSEILEAVLSLPEKYKIVIHLYYYEGYSLNEISEITSTKISTLQTRLQRGRKLLGKKLKEEDIYEQNFIQHCYGQSHNE